MRGNLAYVREGMRRVVNGANGSARSARMPEAGFPVGGKTGTAQVLPLPAERLTGVTMNEDLPWRERDHGLFVGYAPADAPRYVVAVVWSMGEAVNMRCRSPDILARVMNADGFEASEAEPVEITPQGRPG